ncbi:hypothetical protein GBAR_LOCUS21463 [Geodia barretti]|uniref:Carboxypeptidase regulatory-like domain-containing protein n=1 Tax=Geodia barretti TaxID=519541 RepID=A0AA35X5J4_GEOBA|nr:hypothetical protein GBAR_LOCUS21463 [Geodia barretti]
MLVLIAVLWPHTGRGHSLPLRIQESISTVFRDETSTYSELTRRWEAAIAGLKNTELEHAIGNLTQDDYAICVNSTCSSAEHHEGHGRSSSPRGHIRLPRKRQYKSVKSRARSSMARPSRFRHSDLRLHSTVQTASTYEESTTTTDTEGNFRFENVPLDPEALYGVTIRYQGVVYGTDIDLRPESPTPVTVTIYETSDDQSLLSVSSSSLLIPQVDRGFAVPANIPPGEHEVMFAYHFGYDGESVAYDKSYLYGAEKVRILVPTRSATCRAPISELPATCKIATALPSLIE